MPTVWYTDSAGNPQPLPAPLHDHEGQYALASHVHDPVAPTITNPAPFVRAETARTRTFTGGGWSEHPFTTLRHNVGGFTLDGSGNLVIPMAGRYLISTRVFAVAGVGLITSAQISPTPAGESGSYGSNPWWWTEGAPAGSATHTSGGRIFDLAAGTTIRPWVYNRGAANGADGWVEFTVVALDGEQRHLRFTVVEQPVAPDLTWHSLTLENGWVDYGESRYCCPRYRKLANGQVEVQGLVKNGTATTIATLPAGYRPGTSLILPSVTHPNAFTRLNVRTDGTLGPESATYSTLWVSICCTFYAEQ